MSDGNNKESNVRYAGISDIPYHQTNILWTDEPWRGRVLYTGPDGNCDHRVSIEPEHRYVGIGTMSREGTSETDYLWRAAPQTPFHRPKTSKVGEIGWSVPSHQDWSFPNTARQIMLGHFRQEAEDRHSHLYQNPWYPGPNEQFPPDSDAAMVMNVYRNNNNTARSPSKSAAGPRRGSQSQSSEGSRPGDRTQGYLQTRDY